jgi:transketolase
MRNNFINTVLDACSQRDDIFIISGDAGLGVFDDFKEKYPERFLNLGVAEQNTISFAAGLAISGKKVFVYNIIPFVLYRCYEQVRNDICYQRLPVTLVGIGSGVTYAPMGMTHYSVEDVGLARTLPNLTVFSPSDPVEARAAAHFALDAEKPVYVRLAKRGEPDLHAAPCRDIRKPQLLAAGENMALACHGSITGEVLAARSIMAANGLNAAVYSFPMLQPIDANLVEETFRGYKVVVVIEEHYVNCGLGGILADVWSERRIPARIHRIGIPHEFIHDVRNTSGMRRAFGINSSSIAETARSLAGEL